MAVTRIGSVALYNSTMKDVSDVQKKLADLQQQISSGNVAQDFRGLNGQVEQFTQLQAKMDAAKRQIESNQLALSRMNTADQAMSQIVDSADKMESLIVQARSSANTAVDLRGIMQGYLKDMQSSLNINFEGRYLFGGTNTGSAPVPDILVTPVTVGEPDTGYYQGSQTDIIYSKDERSEYAFPIRADDPAFQKIIAAANLAMQAFNGGDDTTMAKALDLMQAGQADLVSSRARVSSTILSVENSNESLTSLNLYWKGVTEQVSKTDLVAASTEVSNHEALLQAAFAVFSRLSQLRLTDYL